MTRIMMFVCVIVVFAAAVVMLYKEPGLVLALIVGMVGWAFFRWKLIVDENENSPEGRPPKHRPRHPNTRLPSDND